MKKLTVIFTLISYITGFSQDVDSLKKELKAAGNDTLRCAILSQLAEFSEGKDMNVYNTELKKLAEQNLENEKEGSYLYKFYTKHLSTAYNNWAIISFENGKMPEAIDQLEMALKMSEKIGDKEGMAQMLNNFGYFYQNMGNIAFALKYYSKSLKANEELKDLGGIAAALVNLGYLYKTQGEIDKATEYYNKALVNYTKIGNQRNIATCLNNIGHLYKLKKDHDKALEYFLKAHKIEVETGDVQQGYITLVGIANIYYGKGETVRATQYAREALEKLEKMGYKKGICMASNALCFIYFNKNSLDEALRYGLQSMAIAKELGYPENICDAAQLLENIYKKRGNSIKALQMFDLYVQMRDSINNQTTKKAAIKEQLEYEYGKKAAADSVRFGEEKKMTDIRIKAQEAQIAQEKTRRYVLYGGVLMVMVLSVFMIRKYRLTQKQKLLIEHQKKEMEFQKNIVDERQKEIIDSITYARRIQRSLLTPEAYIDKAISRLVEKT